MPHSGLDMETPFERLYGEEAILSHLKIIGARAFVHIKDAKKLEPKSWEGMLCGFSEDEALFYRVWNSKNSPGDGEQEPDVYRDSVTSDSTTYTTLCAPGVATSGIGPRLRLNRRSAAGCTGLHRSS